jgi:hypothetical protein
MFHFDLMFQKFVSPFFFLFSFLFPLLFVGVNGAFVYIASALENYLYHSISPNCVYFKCLQYFCIVDMNYFCVNCGNVLG